MKEEKPVKHTQDHQLTHSMVHYLLTIHKLREKNGYARVTDIARELKLTKGSVSTAINNLKKKKLVKEDENRFLFLSEAGHSSVHEILSNRTLLFYFFRDILGVDEETAQNDSCLMEHLLSTESRERFFEFMKKVSSPSMDSFDTQLDLSQFSTIEEFHRAQEGDTHLDHL